MNYTLEMQAINAIKVSIFNLKFVSIQLWQNLLNIEQQINIQQIVREDFYGFVCMHYSGCN